MSANRIGVRDIDWDTYEGQTVAYLEDPEFWEIEILARPTAKDIRWGAKDTNVREWFLTNDENEIVAQGEADGVRACKTAVVAALNAAVN